MNLLRFVFVLVSVTFATGFVLSCSEKESFQYIQPSGDEIVLLHESSEGIPVFYRTEIEGKRIDFFSIRLEGENRVFLNRCRKCFNSGLGFSFEDKYVRCKACNVMYPVREISRGVGSCYPIPVPSRSDGRYSHVKIADLLKAISGP